MNNPFFVITNEAQTNLMTVTSMCSITLYVGASLRESARGCYRRNRPSLLSMVSSTNSLPE